MHFLACVRVLCVSLVGDCLGKTTTETRERRGCTEKSKEPAVSEHKEEEVDTKEVEDDEPVSKSRLNQSSTPLFMSDSPDTDKGNPQDEKDETAE